MLRHGDLNTGNIRYRQKDSGGKVEYIFHDFQFVQLATIGMGMLSLVMNSFDYRFAQLIDFVTLFATLPASLTDEGKDIQVFETVLNTIKETV